MEAESKTINQFATRVRQMILQYQSVTKQNEDLCRQVAEQQERIAKLEAQLQQQRNDYESLKLARMVEITDGDMQSAQKRLAKLIREKRSFEIVPEAFFTRLPAVRAECCGSRARQCSIRQSQQEYSAEDECARIGEAGYGCLPICPETTDVLGGL